MTRVLTALLLIGFAFSATPRVAGATELGGNLLPNPSFEEPVSVAAPPVGWLVQTWGLNSAVVRDGSVSHSGKMSVRIVNPSDNDRGSYALFMQLKPGQKYRFSGWYRTEGLDRFQTSKGVVARFSLLKEREQKSATHTLMAVGEPSEEWRQLSYEFVVPPDVSWLRLDLFLLFQKGTAWWDDVSLATVDAPRPVAAADVLADSLRAAAVIRSETLNLLAASAASDPDTFGRVLKLLDASIGTQLGKQVSFGAEKGKFGGEDEWRFRATAEYLFALSVVYSLPQSRWYRSAQLWEHIGWAFDYLAQEMAPEGRWHDFDTNVDRFTLAPLLESYVLVADQAAPEQAARWFGMIHQAASYQYAAYHPRPLPWGGGYPNMDAYYAHIMAIAGRLTNNSDWLESARLKVRQVGYRLRSNGAYEYVLGWNPSPTYQDIVVNCLGRYYQLTGDDEVLKQFAIVKDYLSLYMEPYGTIDHGMAPHIKHYWSRGESLGLVSAEVLARLTGDGRNKWIAQQKLAPKNLAAIVPGGIYPMAQVLFWLNDVKPEPLADGFFMYLDGIRGFTERQGVKWRSFITGSHEARDTFVSALAGSGGQLGTAFAGAVLEAHDNQGYVYYFSNLYPFIGQLMLPSLAVQQVRTQLHAVGRGVAYPTPVDNLEYAVWNGGSPHTAPWDTNQVWVMLPNWLIGFVDMEATVGADRANGRMVRLHLPLFPDSSTVKANGGYLQAKGLGIHVADITGPWEVLPRGQAAKGPVVSDERIGVEWKPGLRYGATLAVGPVASEDEYFSRLQEDGIYLRRSGDVRLVVRVREGSLQMVAVNTGREPAEVALPAEVLPAGWQALSGNVYPLSEEGPLPQGSQVSVKHSEGWSCGRLNAGQVLVWDLSVAS